MKKFLAKSLLCGAALLSVAGLASCNNSNSANASTEEEEEEDLGFTEVSIFEPVQKEFLQLAGVYFQPVSMNDGNKAEDFDCHLELDIQALKNDYGYGVGEWVPYLTVDYEVTKDTFKTSGTFMPMSASDGPHYGANIKLDGDGTYAVTFTIKFPSSSTYLLHIDEKTGPGAKAYPNTITYTCNDWKFKNGAWNQ